MSGNDQSGLGRHGSPRPQPHQSFVDTDLRPSTAERVPYTDALAESLAEGRLTSQLYEQRLGKAEQAASFAELDDLVKDLPYEPDELRPPQARSSVVRAPRERKRDRRRTRRGFGLAGQTVGVFVLAFILSGTAAEGIARHGADSHTETGGQDFSTSAGKKASAPDNLPELGSGFTEVPPMASKTVPLVAKFIEDNQLGHICTINAGGDSTETSAVDADGKVNTYRLRKDHAPTVDKGSGMFRPLEDMDAVVKLDLRAVLKKARQDSGNESRFSSIDIQSRQLDYTTEKFADIVTVRFSASNDDDKTSISYRIKGMKEVDLDS